MNYNSVNDIIESGITNMTVLVNNVKYDDNYYQITSIPSWLKYNGNLVTSIYASGNSYFGMNSNTVHISVNNRDGAMYYLYVEEGTLYNMYNFFKIRWKGYSVYNSTSSSHMQEYDIIFWSTGDISIHMVQIPSSGDSGNYNLVTSTTLNYTKPTTSLPDCTFYTQNENNSIFTFENALIGLYLNKYIVKSDNKLYNVVDGAFVELPESTLNAEFFNSYGNNEPPDKVLLATLSNPTIYCWTNKEESKVTPVSAVVRGAPFMQTIYSPNYNMSDETIKGIECVFATASSDVLFAVSPNNGETWYMWTGSEWGVLSETYTGMNTQIFNDITSTQWLDFPISNTIMVRATIPTIDDYITSLIIDFVN